MLEGRMPQGQLLKKIFECVKEMVNDVNLECSSTGIGLQAMDASHVALVCVSLFNGAFDYYTCTEQYYLGLNMTQVSVIMKLCGADDQIILRHNPTENAERMSFVFESPGDERVSHFDLRLMSFDTDSLGIPETTFEANVEMPSKHFIKVINDLSHFSDTIHIQISPKGIRFSANGDFGSGMTLFKADGNAENEEKINIECTNTIYSVFAARYLLYFTKGASLGDIVKLSITPKQPLQVKINLKNNPLVGSITYFLAPKLDDDAE